MGAVDLRLRHDEIVRWFAGLPVYSDFITAVYPPATYVILWPIVGWTDFPATRWIWAMTTVAALLLTMFLFIRGSMAITKPERILIALMVIATYPAGAAIGNGQLSIHAMVAVVAAILLVSKNPSRWQQWLAVPLVLFSMIKPNSTIPFLLIILFLPFGAPIIAVSAILYMGLTVFATSFQPTGFNPLIHAWLYRIKMLGRYTSSTHYANLDSWLSLLGLYGWMLPVSAIILAVLAVWIYRHRKCDIWLLLAVAAIIARMWTYHRWYDDILLLIPMTTLHRLTKTDSTFSGPKTASTLFVAGMITMLAPGGLYLLPGTWPIIFTTCQTILWLTYLFFLVGWVSSDARRAQRP